MKRFLLLLGPGAALIGSLGLVAFGDAVVGVFDVLTFRIVDPPEPPPDSLTELEASVFSAMAVVIGLIVSCFAVAVRDRRQKLYTTGRLLYVGAGMTVIVGTLPLAWSVLGAIGSFRVIATSAGAPTIESVQVMIVSTQSTMTFGYVIFVISSALSLAAGCFGFRARMWQSAGGSNVLSMVFAIGSVLVGVVLLLLLASIWLNGTALSAMLTDTSATPKPAELAANLSGILYKSLLVFGGLAMLGLLHVLASAFADAGSEGQATTVSE